MNPSKSVPSHPSRIGSVSRRSLLSAAAASTVGGSSLLLPALSFADIESAGLGNSMYMGPFGLSLPSYASYQLVGQVMAGLISFLRDEFIEMHKLIYPEAVNPMPWVLGVLGAVGAAAGADIVKNYGPWVLNPDKSFSVKKCIGFIFTIAVPAYFLRFADKALDYRANQYIITAAQENQLHPRVIGESAKIALKAVIVMASASVMAAVFSETLTMFAKKHVDNSTTGTPRRNLLASMDVMADTTHTVMKMRSVGDNQFNIDKLSGDVIRGTVRYGNFLGHGVIIAVETELDSKLPLTTRRFMVKNLSLGTVVRPYSQFIDKLY